MCPPTGRGKCFSSDLLILILLCVCSVSQLNWRKRFGRGLTATRSAGLRERPLSLSPNVSIKAWRRPSLPCSRTTPNTTEVRKENSCGRKIHKPLTQGNNQVRQVREEVQETRCVTLKLISTCGNIMQCLLWLVSSHRPEQAPPTVFPHQLCRAGGVAVRVTVSLWHHSVTDVLTARLKAEVMDTSSVFWYFHSIYDALIVIKTFPPSFLSSVSRRVWAGAVVEFLCDSSDVARHRSQPGVFLHHDQRVLRRAARWQMSDPAAGNLVPTHSDREQNTLWHDFISPQDIWVKEVHIRVGVLNYLPDLNHRGGRSENNPVSVWFSR